MYKMKKIVFYDPEGTRQSLATQFFANVRYSDSALFDTIVITVNNIPKKKDFIIYQLL